MPAMSFAIANSVRASRDIEFQEYLYNMKKNEEERNKKKRKGLFVFKNDIPKEMETIFEPRENITNAQPKDLKKRFCCF